MLELRRNESVSREVFCYSAQMKQILLIEDDQKLSALLETSILEDGFAVETVGSEENLDRTLRGEHHYDLVVMDRLIGALDTKTKTNDLRQRWPEIPILVISAINTPTERAELINEGADDYLGKPFHTEELLARMRSLLRRAPEKKSIRKIGKATLDLTNRRISVGDKFEDLSHKEFVILNILSEKKKVFSRHEILQIVWGNINHSETNLVEATITNLRRRISSLECGFEIKNQRNTGYWIED